MVLKKASQEANEDHMEEKQQTPSQAATDLEQEISREPTSALIEKAQHDTPQPAPGLATSNSFSTDPVVYCYSSDSPKQPPVVNSNIAGKEKRIKTSARKKKISWI